jgi:hypothetical protein
MPRNMNPSMAPPVTTASVDGSDTDASANVFTPPGSNDQDTLNPTDTALAERMAGIVNSIDSFPTVKVARKISARYALNLGRTTNDIRALIKNLPDTSSAYWENRYLLEYILNNIYVCSKAAKDQSIVPRSFAVGHGAVDGKTEQARVEVKRGDVRVVAKFGGHQKLRTDGVQAAGTPSNKQRSIEELRSQSFSSLSNEEELASSSTRRKAAILRLNRLYPRTIKNRLRKLPNPAMRPISGAKILSRL